MHKIYPVLAQTNCLHHFDCQVVKKIFKSVLKQSNWPAIPSHPTVLGLLISLAPVLEADTFSCQKRMLPFSQKINEIAVTSYKSTSLTPCVRLSNQLRKILIFFSLWNYGWAGQGPNSASSYRHLVCKIGLSPQTKEKFLILHWLQKPILSALFERLTWLIHFGFGLLLTVNLIFMFW